VTIDSTGLQFWDGTGWITLAKGAKGATGPSGPAGASVPQVTSLTSRNLTIIGSPNATTAAEWFHLSNLSARTDEVNPPVTPDGDRWRFIETRPWAYWVSVHFIVIGVAQTERSFTNIIRRHSDDSSDEVVRTTAAYAEDSWTTSGVFLHVDPTDRLLVAGYTQLSNSNYRSWMTVSPIGPIYL
jgi:hypothetical protein